MRIDPIWRALGLAIACAIQVASIDFAAADQKAAKTATRAAEAAAKKAESATRQKKLEIAAEQWKIALAQWTEAIANEAGFPAILGAAAAERKLGTSHLAYRRLAAVETGSLPAQQQSQLKATLDELSAEVSLVSLDVTPAGATISVNGEELGKAPVSAIAFASGEYTLEFSADGFQPKQLRINLEAGTENERKVVLEPIPIFVAPKEEPRPQPPPPPPPKVKKRGLIVSLSATAAFAGAGGVFAYLAKSRHNTYQDTTASVDDRVNAQTDGKRYALVADIAWVATAAAAATATYYYFAVYRKSTGRSGEKNSQQSKKMVTAWVQPSAVPAATPTVGLLVTSSF